jgi:hypothetical protein
VNEPAAASVSVQLSPGEVTRIGDRFFKIGELIGEGAYAKVYAAKMLPRGGSQGKQGDEEGLDVAIKEMLCGTG